MSGFRHLGGRLPLLFLLAIATGLTLAACGGGSSSSSSSSTESSGSGAAGRPEPDSAVRDATYLGEGETGLGIRPAGGNGQEEAEALGTKAGEAGKRVKLPPAKIGIINYLNGLESGDRVTDSAVYAAANLGWSTTICDGKGTPSQWIACGDSLLAEGVDALVEVALEPGQIQPVITKAKSMGVPVVQVGGGEITTGELNGNFGPSSTKLGKILSDALLEKLDSLSEEPVEIAVHTFPAKWGTSRTEQLEKGVAAQSKVKIATTTVTDAANLVPFTREAVTTQITQNPNLKAFWFSFDATGQVGGQVVASKYAGKEFPERPLVATFDADHATLGLMEEGAVNMVSDVNFDASAWEGIDGIAKELAREEPMTTANQPTYPGIGDPYTYQIVTDEDLPPKGEYPTPKWDVPSYFLAKWKAEYGA